VEVFSLFFFEVKIGEVNKEDFENNIIVRKFDNNLSKFGNHLISE